VSRRYRIGHLLVGAPDLLLALGVIPELPKDLEGLLGCLAPHLGTLQGTSVPLPHEAGVVAADLLLDELRDVPAATARAGDGVDEGKRLLGEGDVRSDQAHRVTLCVNPTHTA